MPTVEPKGLPQRRESTAPQNDPEKPLNESDVAQWRTKLGTKAAYLLKRGLTLSIIEEFELGFDGTRITLPIRDADGQLVNVRRYLPNARASKMLNIKGHGRPTRLYPPTTTDSSEWQIIGGGEWDMLSARAEGVEAFCGTNGESSVPDAAMLEPFRDKKVAVLLDADKTGRAAARKWSKALSGIASEVRVVQFPDEGMDLNDFMLLGGGYESVLALIAAASPASAGKRRSVTELLALARRQLADHGSRNQAGFYLAVQMRDERYSAEEAWRLALAPFQAEVENDGKDRPYTEAEARQSITQAYATEPRVAVGRRASAEYPLTELGNAERLIASHGDELRYLAPTSQWLIYREGRWATDQRGVVMGWMVDTVRAIRDEADGLDDDAAKRIFSWARSSESRARLESALKLAQTLPGIAMLPKDFDLDPALLNVRNGTLDLRTGSLREHRASDHLRRQVPVDYNPKARAPLFDAFMRRVQPDPATRDFIQRAAGYSATGATTEQKLLLLHSSGQSGKSTLVELLFDLFGEYASILPAEALVLRSADRIPNDIARLEGARFVSVIEFDDSARLNERLVKQLTGGDTVTARFMRGEFFDFRPQCTIWVSSNHRPVVTGTDEGIWRRFLLVDFPVRIPDAERDDALGARIRAAELPGLLRWVVEGAVEWHRQGLNPPVSVLDATADYRSDSDVLGGFLDEECDVTPEASVSKADLYYRYTEWCRAAGLRPATKYGFGRMLRERSGLDVAEDRVGKAKAHVWVGLRLRDLSSGVLRIAPVTPIAPEAGGSSSAAQVAPKTLRTVRRPKAR